MQISEDILKETTECKRNFICLNSLDTVKTCKVISCINNKVHFVECANYYICPYLMPFGNSFICNCPVRKEIFNKYGV